MIQFLLRSVAALVIGWCLGWTFISALGATGGW